MAGSRAAAATTGQAGGEVWAVCGVGRTVPQPVWEVVAERHGAHDEPWELDDEVLPVELITSVLGPRACWTRPPPSRRATRPWPPSCSRKACSRAVGLSAVRL
ncbi:MAG: hypothetical protein R2749_21415 [Acidimicrobiales bacterium]